MMEYENIKTGIFQVKGGHRLSGHFGGQKSRFLDFFKVVLESFRKFLSIFFGIKIPTFGCNFSSKV